jgi:hypothetical protein
MILALVDELTWQNSAPASGSGRDLDRALDHPNQIGVHALQPITRPLAETTGPFDATPSGR